MRAVQRLKGAAQPSGAVEKLFRLVEGDLAHVNALILERMRSDVPMIPELAGHLINSGGKRLRPMLTLAAAQLCGYQGLATYVSRPQWNSFTPRRCCTTM